MTGSLKHLIGAASLLTALTGATAAWAQAGRPWVDPPADTSATAKTPSQMPAPAASTSGPASQSEQKAPPTAASEPRTESAGTAQPTPSTENSAVASESSSRKTADDGKIRRSSKKSTVATGSKTPSKRKIVASDRSKASPTARISEAQRSTRGGIRSAKLRDGINSGLEVMSLRTIEFPDGRRVEVLVRPSPRALSRLMDEP